MDPNTNSTNPQQDDDLNDNLSYSDDALLSNGFSDVDDLGDDEEPGLGMQSTHNSQDDDDDEEDVTGEDIRIGYQDTTEDENDIQKASNSNTTFKYAAEDETLSSKTVMRGSVGQSTMVTDLTNDDDDDDTTTMVVDTASDTQNELDYGIRDDGDSGDDTAGAIGAQGERLSGYYERSDDQTGGPGTHD
jgi:hypothetical protein